MPRSEGVGDRRVGVKDGEIFRLPAANNEDVLQRGEKEWEVTDCLAVIPKPKGDTQAIGTGVATNTGAFVEIVAHTITDEKTFHIAKIKVPCENSHWVKLKIGDTEYPADIVPDDTTFIDWFPWDDGVLGDGAKKVSILAKAVATGETLYGTILGQED